MILAPRPQIPHLTQGLVYKHSICIFPADEVSVMSIPQRSSTISLTPKSGVPDPKVVHGSEGTDQEAGG